MTDNPFVSALFTSHWIQCYRKGEKETRFPWLNPLSFVKSKRLPCFINTGTRFTKGLTYTLDPERAIVGNEAYLVYDVLTHEQPDYSGLPKNAGLLVSPQYPGYLIDVKEYASLQDFLQKKFSKSSRYKLTKYKKRLEAAFEIRYQMYWGAIDKETYDQVFRHFRLLLEKRFDDKQETNNNLAPDEWNFFTKVAYPMILEQSAGLFVVYDGATPIAVTLNFMSDTTVFDAITVFDIDYAKFHLGSVSVMGLIEWCIGNGMEILDFSKGEFDYKKRWATREYRFEYHIFYNKRSLQSRLVAVSLVSFFRLKQVFREWKLNEWFHRLTYRIKKGGPQTPDARVSFSFEEFEGDPPGLIGPIGRENPEYQMLKPAFFEFLYLHSENSAKTEILKLSDRGGYYFLRGENKQVIVRLGG